MMQYGQSAQVDSGAGGGSCGLLGSTGSLGLGSTAAAAPVNPMLTNAQKPTNPTVFNFINGSSSDSLYKQLGPCWKMTDPKI